MKAGIVQILSALLVSTAVAQAGGLEELDARLSALHAENVALKKLQKIQSLEKENAELRRQIGVGAESASPRAATPSPGTKVHFGPTEYIDVSGQRRSIAAPLQPAYAKVIPASPDPAISASRWVGAYVGAHVGAAAGDWPYRMHGSSSFQSTYYVANPVCCGGTNVPYTSTTTYDSDTVAGPLGAVVGGQAGYRWQMGQLVFGPEFDLSASTAQQTKTTTVTYVTTSNPPFYPRQQYTGQSNVTASLDWIASARAQLGIAFGNLLFFGTGGFAVAGADIQSSWSASNKSFYPIGYIIGGGLEWAANENISLRMEYMYLGLQKETWQDQNFTFELDPSTHVVRTAVNWRWQ